jgi:hypothetical protein
MKLGPGHRETLFLSQPPPDERLLLLAPSRNLLQLKDGRAHCDIRQYQGDGPRQIGKYRVPEEPKRFWISGQRPNPLFERTSIDDIALDRRRSDHAGRDR